MEKLSAARVLIYTYIDLRVALALGVVLNYLNTHINRANSLEKFLVRVPSLYLALLYVCCQKAKKMYMDRILDFRRTPLV